LKSRTEVEELLADHDLDDHAVAAEAMRQVAPDLEKLDRMLSNLELRRDRALRNIEDLRAGQANGVRETSDRLSTTIFWRYPIPTSEQAKPWRANARSRPTAAMRAARLVRARELANGRPAKTPSATA
jgi:hypothetical protein